MTLPSSLNSILGVSRCSWTPRLVSTSYSQCLLESLTGRLTLAGQDATESFFGLHRHEVLEKPNHQRLKIGSIENEEPVLYGRPKGELSDVPYGEPTWLSKGYYSP